MSFNSTNDEILPSSPLYNFCSELDMAFIQSDPDDYNSGGGYCDSDDDSDDDSADGDNSVVAQSSMKNLKWSSKAAASTSISPFDHDKLFQRPELRRSGHCTFGDDEKSIYTSMCSVFPVRNLERFFDNHNMFVPPNSEINSDDEITIPTGVSRDVSRDVSRGVSLSMSHSNDINDIISEYDVNVIPQYITPPKTRLGHHVYDHVVDDLEQNKFDRVLKLMCTIAKIPFKKTFCDEEQRKLFEEHDAACRRVALFHGDKYKDKFDVVRYTFSGYTLFSFTDWMSEK